MRKVPYSSEPLLLAADQRVWVDWVNGVSVDPVEQYKRIATLEAFARAWDYCDELLPGVEPWSQRLAAVRRARTAVGEVKP